MVATDIVARGIDVRGISHVIDFDVPLFAPDEHDELRRIGGFIGCRLALEDYEGFTCAQFAATLSRSEEQSRTQRWVACARKAAKRPRLVRKRNRGSSFASARRRGKKRIGP